MSLFDSFRRDKKPHAAANNDTTSEASTVSSEDVAENEISSSGEMITETTEEAKTQPIQAEEQIPIEKRPLKGLDEKKPITHTIGETKIIAIINQKGGVGKSTTAINLSAALGASGKAVLLVDLDPQGNATSGLGIDKGQISYDIYDVLLSDASVDTAIVADVCEGLDVLPATINLAGAEVELA